MPLEFGRHTPLIIDALEPLALMYGDVDALILSSLAVQASTAEARARHDQRELQAEREAERPRPSFLETVAGNCIGSANTILQKLRR
jgi:hypothetical protein